ncbi:MAG: hypothetical protein AUG08_00735 [Acidobacteria bacterium 13_1_20CM_2_55_15]|nr:MAG: hypothetical protein AUG08_00735 [Acidobacteria bacterium 13_1_20CM_2_55_15]
MRRSKPQSFSSYSLSLGAKSTSAPGRSQDQDNGIQPHKKERRGDTPRLQVEDRKDSGQNEY